jgi:hypothetical protein
MTLENIHLATKAMGRSFKRETLGKHFAICLGGQKPVLDEATAQRIADGSREAQSQAEMDFAIMVQQRATQLLRDGSLRVTAQHGLTAQALLDRRAEKAADRDLALNMARLLSGSVIMPPVHVIEGRAVEIRGLPDGLAPEGVYEPVDA